MQPIGNVPGPASARNAATVPGGKSDAAPQKRSMAQAVRHAASTATADKRLSAAHTADSQARATAPPQYLQASAASTSPHGLKDPDAAMTASQSPTVARGAGTRMHGEMPLPPAPAAGTPALVQHETVSKHQQTPAGCSAQAAPKPCPSAAAAAVPGAATPAGPCRPASTPAGNPIRRVASKRPQPGTVPRPTAMRRQAGPLVQSVAGLLGMTVDNVMDLYQRPPPEFFDLTADVGSSRAALSEDTIDLASSDSDSEDAAEHARPNRDDMQVEVAEPHGKPKGKRPAEQTGVEDIRKRPNHGAAVKPPARAVAPPANKGTTQPAADAPTAAYAMTSAVAPAFYCKATGHNTLAAKLAGDAAASPARSAAGDSTSLGLIIQRSLPATAPRMGLNAKSAPQAPATAAAHPDTPTMAQASCSTPHATAAGAAPAAAGPAQLGANSPAGSAMPHASHAAAPSRSQGHASHVADSQHTAYQSAASKEPSESSGGQHAANEVVQLEPQEPPESQERAFSSPSIPDLGPLQAWDHLGKDDQGWQKGEGHQDDAQGYNGKCWEDAACQDEISGTPSSPLDAGQMVQERSGRLHGTLRIGAELMQGAGLEEDVQSEVHAAPADHAAPSPVVHTALAGHAAPAEPSQQAECVGPTVEEVQRFEAAMPAAGGAEMHGELDMSAAAQVDTVQMSPVQMHGTLQLTTETQSVAPEQQQQASHPQQHALLPPLEAPASPPPQNVRPRGTVNDRSRQIPSPVRSPQHPCIEAMQAHANNVSDLNLLAQETIDLTLSSDDDADDDADAHVPPAPIPPAPEQQVALGEFAQQLVGLGIPDDLATGIETAYSSAQELRDSYKKSVQDAIRNGRVLVSNLRGMLYTIKGLRGIEELTMQQSELLYDEFGAFEVQQVLQQAELGAA